MKASIRERIDLLLPTRVTRFELVDNHHPIMRTDVITLEITGPFVGCQGSHSLWEEVEPSVLASKISTEYLHICKLHTTNSLYL